MFEYAQSLQSSENLESNVVVVEFIGYSARASATDKTDMLMPFIIQNAFILLPPALFAATIYMCLGRIIRLVGGDHLSILRPGIVTKVFVTGDVLSFLIQGGSAGLMVMGSTNPTMAIIGQDMVLAGLAAQLVSFAFFMLTAFIFHLRIRKNPTARSYEVDQSWIRSMYMLYGLSFLIIVRSIFRIVEYCMGQDGYALSHEWTLYIFDTVLMFGCAVIFYFLYPSNLTPKFDDAMQLESQTSGENIIPKYP